MMARYPRRRYLQLSGKRVNLQVILSVSLIVGFLLIGARDFFALENGKGGSDWRIGVSSIGVLDAHQPRSLIENRALALRLVNRDRQLNGLSPLVEDALLAQAAQLHAQDMLTRRYYAHETPEGKTPTDRFSRLGGQGGVGENIMQQTGAPGVVLSYRLIEKFQKSWMYSPGHRFNLLTPSYSRFGYGIAADPFTGRVYSVQNFSH
ncbi:Cysteine-rich secretory protein family [Cyanobium gracile PCC 6307]|uniref:Cysteine-rich secretory protein family n=1 Tax=Cyanobium gracile (strain ATCC 27147 / PCC 6307) TaxID=292564 RepID=K9P7R3_CYAGP|nr:Cysteine-rich secretory protein family [Cyanobium gracile PCC 6307]